MNDYNGRNEANSDDVPYSGGPKYRDYRDISQYSEGIPAEAPESGEALPASCRDHSDGNAYPPDANAGWTQGSSYQTVIRSNDAPQEYHAVEKANTGSYQYDPRSGWQTNRKSSSYEWNYEQYRRLDKSSGKTGRNRGLVVFTVSLVCVLVLGLFGITGYSVVIGTLNNTGDGTFASSGVAEGVIRDFESSYPETMHGELELASKPQISETIPVGGKLTTPQIAKLVSPSVVGVSTLESSNYYMPIAVGSGIIMSDDGYIITNAHVVAGGTHFKIQLYDNTPYEAELIGADANTDLAILKIKADDLVAAKFGDSNDMEVGETVIAIGNPSGMDLAGSVTQGIISAVNRLVRTDSYSFNYIQTDAAINPGNSGGALVNEYGQVIGINSSKIVAQGYEGIGFAIPISDAKPILDDIIQNGRVTGRVMLGIGFTVVGEIDAERYNVPMGLEIKEIYPQSDLINTDAQLGDILIEIDGQRVRSQPDVQQVLKNKKIGDTVTLKLFRRLSALQDTEFEVTIRLVEI